MKTILSALVFTAAISGQALAIEPIPGSITYEGPSQSTLSKTPVGSVYLHEFEYRGNRYREVYRVAADHRLELVGRTQGNS